MLLIVTFSPCLIFIMYTLLGIVLILIVSSLTSVMIMMSLFVQVIFYFIVKVKSSSDSNNLIYHLVKSLYLMLMILSLIKVIDTFFVIIQIYLLFS